MKRAIIESPYGTQPDGSRCSPDEIAANVAYLKRCIRYLLDKGYAPFASHGFYPLVLDDATPEERKLGIEAGLAWGAAAEHVFVFRDRGVTDGMRQGIERHRANGVGVTNVYLDENRDRVPEERWP